MNKNTFFGWLLAAVIIWAPSMHYAQAQLVPNCGNGTVGIGFQECTFNDFVQFAGRVTNFLVFKVGSVCAVLALLLLGIRTIMAQGKGNALAELKSLGWDILIGYLLIVGAWGIVTSIFTYIDPQYQIFIF